MGEDDCNNAEESHHQNSHHHHSHFKREYLDQKTKVPSNSVLEFLGNIVETSTSMFHNLVLRCRGEPYAFYHRVYPRVPMIDECYADDGICIKEAELQYNRDRIVEAQIIRILRTRRSECISWYSGDKRIEERQAFCQKEKEDYEKAMENYFIKYGDIGHYVSVVDVYMKQKHRLIWERRFGKFAANNAKVEEFIKKDESMVEKLRHSFGKTGLPRNM